MRIKLDSTQTSRGFRRVLLLVSLSAATLVAFASPAQAAFGLDGLVASPADTEAGAHSDFHTHLEVTSPGDQLRDLTVSLPPGLSGNPQSVPKCSVDELNADDCPDASQIGTTSVHLTTLSLVPLTVDGSVYNVTPQPGEPARLGIVLRPPDPTTLLLPPIIQQVKVELRPDYGLDTILTDLPKNAAILSLIPVGIAIDSIDLDLDGSFMRNPTSCGTQTTSFSARSWAMGEGDSSVTGSTTFESTDCGSQPYDPKATLEIDGNGSPLVSPASPTVTSVITQTEAEANNKRVSVLLPSTIGVNAERLNQTCQPTDFQAGTCAEETKVGNAVAVSPLLDSELSGPVYVVAAPGLPNIGVDLKGSLPLKILGASTFRDDRVETIFEGLPDLPLSRFELTFPGGPGGLLRVTGNVCDSTSTFDADFTSQAGQTLSRTLPTIVKGTCPETGGGYGKGDGDGGQIIRPSAKVQVAGAKRHRPRVSMRVTSGGAAINSLQVKLPSALKLRRGVGKRIVVKADGKRIRGQKRIIVNGRTLKVRGLPANGAGVLKIALRGQVFKSPKRLRKGRKLIFKLKVARSGQMPANLKASARARK